MSKDIKDSLSFNWEIADKKLKGFTDLGNYLFLVDELEEVDLDEAIETNIAIASGPDGGCTCCAKIADNGDMLVGRNMDIDARQFPTFLIPTSFGKYRTFNVAYMFNGPWKYKDILAAGEMDERVLRALCFGSTDVFNEKGLYIETNMRTPSDKFPFLPTNPGKKRALWTMIPALACAFCATVEEALDYIKNSYDYFVANNAAAGMEG